MWVVPSTSSPSVPATASEISRSDWRFQALEREFSWREKPMPARLWHARWKKAHWLQALASGLISEPSTPGPSLDAWIASWRRTRASRSVTPGSDSAKTIHVISGPSSAKSSALPTLPWYSSKTFEVICEEDSAASAVIFKEWATALRRDCGLRRKWARRKVVSDCSPWPTPTGRDFKNPERSAAGMTRKAEGGWSVDLNTAAHLWNEPQNWPTPNVSTSPNSHGMRGGRHDNGHQSGADLETTARNWQSPGTDSFRSRGGDRKNEMGLDQEARNWQSPQARDHRDGRIEPETAAKHLGSRPLNEEVLNWRTPVMRDHHPHTLANRTRNIPTILLSHQVENWPSPAVTDGESAARQTTTTGVMHPGMSLTDAIREFSTTLPTEPETGNAGTTCWCGLHGCALPSHRRKLNIYFSEWLMGWPINWSSAGTGLTAYAQWETASARLVWQWLSAYCARPMGLGVSDQMDLF